MSVASSAVSRSANFGPARKRRKFARPSQKNAGFVALRRVAALSRQMKPMRRMKMFQISGQTAFTTISTTGSLVALDGLIAEGTDSVNRLGDHIDARHLNIRLVLNAGTTQAINQPGRLTVFIGQSGLTFANTPSMVQSYSPTTNNIVNRKLYEKFFMVPCSTATVPSGWPVEFEISLPLRGHRVKFNGASTNSNQGPTLYVELESLATAGTAAPTVAAGLLEYFFMDS